MIIKDAPLSEYEGTLIQDKLYHHIYTKYGGLSKDARQAVITLLHSYPDSYGFIPSHPAELSELIAKYCWIRYYFEDWTLSALKSVGLVTWEVV